MLLRAEPVVKQMTAEITSYIHTYALTNRYVAIFLLSDDVSSEVYVSLKAKKAVELELYADIKLGKDWSTVEVIDEIAICNRDENCLGIMVQLPLADHLYEDQRKILDSIVPEKDIDGLGSALLGKSCFGAVSFLPATPKAALALLDAYDIGDVHGAHAVVIGRSNLIGKPLAIELIERGATVSVANSHTPSDMLAALLVWATYIFSATGQKHLINKDILHTNLKDKVLVDIGRGSDEDGPYGDIDRSWYADKVRAVTPVPGGVGPVTVASLFHNIIVLHRASSTVQ